MISIIAAIALAIQPWTGNDFQATAAAAARYRLQVSGKPNSVVRLQATGVSDGWIAAFCTPEYCSPQHADVKITRNGQAVVQFELIRETASAPKSSGAKITSTDGSTISVPIAYR